MTTRSDDEPRAQMYFPDVERLRLVVETLANDDMITYHVDQLLNPTGESTTFSKVHGHATPRTLFPDDKDAVAPVTQALADLLYRIPGIVSNDLTLDGGIIIDDYYVMIVKGKAFSFDEINRGVIEVFMEIFDLPADRIDATIEESGRTPDDGDDQVHISFD